MTNQIKKIGKFQAFPIYRVSWKWEQDGEHDNKYPESYSQKDMPLGRIRNSMSHNFMFKEELSEPDLKIKIDEYFKNSIKFKNDEYIKNNKLNLLINNIDKITTDIKLKYETWNLTWFQHETFDIGLTDKEYLQSFEEFVERYEDMQDRMPGDAYPENYHCLMGAEDRWRWHGAEPNGG